MTTRCMLRNEGYGGRPPFFFCSGDAGVVVLNGSASAPIFLYREAVAAFVHSMVILYRFPRGGGSSTNRQPKNQNGTLKFHDDEDKIIMSSRVFVNYE